MSFRARLTLVSATAVAVAVVLVAVASYVAVRGTLRGELDDGLRQQARAGQLIFRRAGGLEPRPPATLPLPAPAPAPGRERAYLQVIGSGTVMRPLGSSVRLPVSSRARRVADGKAGAFFQDRDVRGSELRIYTVPAGRGRALQLARPLGEIDSALARLRLVLAGLCLVGVALAVALGRFVSLEAAQRALDASVVAQRQLVADASHELRTPVASLRTNVEVLREADALPRDERERLHDDVDEQISELGALVNDVIELARGDEPPSRPEEVRLDLLVQESVERMRRLVPERVVVVEAEPALVSGVPERLARAVNNVLDNAVKWGPPGAPVEVTVRAGEVAVRDHGRGIPADELPHVFDRFYRGAGARDRAGSGLGLAIVRQVAVSHGGTVEADAALGGGTTVRLRLRATAFAPPPASAHRKCAEDVPHYARSSLVELADRSGKRLPRARERSSADCWRAPARTPPTTRPPSAAHWPAASSAQTRSPPSTARSCQRSARRRSGQRCIREPRRTPGLLGLVIKRSPDGPALAARGARRRRAAAPPGAAGSGPPPRQGRPARAHRPARGGRPGPTRPGPAPVVRRSRAPAHCVALAPEAPSGAPPPGGPTPWGSLSWQA